MGFRKCLLSAKPGLQKDSRAAAVHQSCLTFSAQPLPGLGGPGGQWLRAMDLQGMRNNSIHRQNYDVCSMSGD